MAQSYETKPRVVKSDKALPAFDHDKATVKQLALRVKALEKALGIKEG